MKNTGETLIDAHLETAVDREYRRVQFLKRRDVLLSILTPLLLLAAWEIAARSGAIDARLFTPPSAIGTRAWEMIEIGRASCRDRAERTAEDRAGGRGEKRHERG